MQQPPQQAVSDLNQFFIGLRTLNGQRDQQGRLFNKGDLADYLKTADNETTLNTTLDTLMSTAALIEQQETYVRNKFQGVDDSKKDAFVNSFKRFAKSDGITYAAERAEAEVNGSQQLPVRPDDVVMNAGDNDQLMQENDDDWKKACNNSDLPNDVKAVMCTGNGGGFYDNLKEMLNGMSRLLVEFINETNGTIKQLQTQVTSNDSGIAALKKENELLGDKVETLSSVIEENAKMLKDIQKKTILGKQKYDKIAQEAQADLNAVKKMRVQTVKPGNPIPNNELHPDDVRMKPETVLPVLEVGQPRRRGLRNLI